MKSQRFAAATVVLTLPFVAGCGDMDRASLQDAIQRDLNTTAHRFVVESVHCRRDHTISDEDYMCALQQSGGGVAGVAVNVSGNDWSVVGKPVVLP